MTISEFLASEPFERDLKKARATIRSGGGTGKLVITLDFNEDAFRSGRVETQISSSRIDAKQFRPE